MKNKKAIAILGGMGPEASVYMYRRLIELSVEKFGVKHNDEFPEIILQSIPVPDFISSTKEKQKALKMLQDRVVQLNKLDISCLSIACNTAHLLLPDLQKVSKVPFISMIAAVVDAVQNDKRKKIGIIGTPMTTKTKLYQSVLEKYGIKTIVPTDAQLKTQETIIRNVISGKLLNSDTKKLQNIADSLRKKGAEGIILGCTEIPLAFPKKYLLPIYNSVDILSLALLRNYYDVNYRMKGGEKYDARKSR